MNAFRQINILQMIPNILQKRSISSTQVLKFIQKESRLRVIDNSDIGKQAMLQGKPPKCIHVYNKIRKGTIGDKILVAIKGQKVQAVIVGVKMNQKHGIPRMDSNNIILLNNEGNPLGSRILLPIPGSLRKSNKGDFSKILAIATKII